MFAIMQNGNPAAKGWVPASDCTGADACTGGALCCEDPAQGAAARGACYAVHACSDIVNGGGGPNMTAPFGIVQVNFDTGAPIKVKDLAPLCAIEGGKQCPWSLEFPNV